MANSVDPDQLASEEANWSGSTVCKGRLYPGLAGLELIYANNKKANAIYNISDNWNVYICTNQL